MKDFTTSVTDSFISVGENIKTWRRIYSLKAAQVAERAGISPGTLRKIESGDPTVSVGAYLEVLRSLGLLDAFTESTDPLNTDIGRMRVTENLPKRVR